MAGRKFYFVIFLITAVGSSAVPQTGGAAGAFNAMGNGARAVGLMGSFTAVADDAWAVFYNPGGMDQVPGGQAQFTYWRPFTAVEGINYAGLAMTKSFSGAGFALGTVGLGVQYFKASGIAEADLGGITGDTFSDYEMVFRFGWSKGFGGSLATGRPPSYYFGLAAKVVSSRVYEYADGGFGLDVGLLLKPAGPVKIGIAAENVVSPQITILEHGDSYPVRGRLGFAYGLGRYGVAAAEVRADDRGDYEIAVAGEAVPVGLFAVRGGYEFVYKGWSVGGGVRAGSVLADFAYRPHTELGGSYVVTVGLNF